MSFRVPRWPLRANTAMPLIRGAKHIFVVDPALNTFRDILEPRNVFIRSAAGQRRHIDPLFGDVMQSTTGQMLTLNRAIFTATPFSVGVWCKQVGLSNGESIFRIYNSGATSESFRIYIQSTGLARCDTSTVADGTSPASTATGVVTAGVWVFYTAVWTSASSRAIFVNGANKVTNAGSRTPSGLDRTIIGENLNGVAQFGPVICFPYALSDGAVAALYAAAKRFSYLEEDPASWGTIDVSGTVVTVEIVVANTATMAVSANATRPVAPTIDNTATVAVATGAARPVAATVASTSTVAVSANVVRGVATTVANTSTVTAAVNALRRVSPVVATTSTIVAGSAISRALATTVANTSTIAVATAVLRQIATTVASTTTIADAINAMRPVAPTVASAVTIDVMAELTGELEISLTVSNTCTIAVATTVLRASAATLAASSTISSTANALRTVSPTVAVTVTIAVTANRAFAQAVTVATVATIAPSINALRRVSLDANSTATFAIGAASGVVAGTNFVVSSTIVAEARVLRRVAPTVSNSATILLSSALARQVSQNLDVLVTMAVAINALRPVAPTLNATSVITVETADVGLEALIERIVPFHMHRDRTVALRLS